MFLQCFWFKPVGRLSSDHRRFDENGPLRLGTVGASMGPKISRALEISVPYSHAWFSLLGPVLELQAARTLKWILPWWRSTIVDGLLLPDVWFIEKIFLCTDCFVNFFFISKPPLCLYIFIGMLFLLLNLTLPCHSSSFLSFVSFCLTLFAFGPLQLPTHSLGSPQLLQNWINRGSQVLFRLSVIQRFFFFFLSTTSLPPSLLFYYFHYYSSAFPSWFLIFLVFFFLLASIDVPWSIQRSSCWWRTETFFVNKCWIYVIIVDGYFHVKGCLDNTPLFGAPEILKYFLVSFYMLTLFRVKWFLSSFFKTVLYALEKVLSSYSECDKGRSYS